MWTARSSGKTTAKKAKKSVPGQGELLMPIAGRKAEPKEEVKPAKQPAGRRKAG
jgi:hypothetical protein